MLIIHDSSVPKVNPLLTKQLHHLTIPHNRLATSLYQTPIAPVDAVVGTTTAVATTSTSAVPFIKLLAAFLAGGLFFSTVLSASATVYAFGLENIKSLWSSISIVSKKVWETFLGSLGETKAAFSGKEYEKGWNFKSAWKTLLQELGQTRKMAVQGIQAIQEEGKLYSSVVGAPGLVPLQYLSNNLMPLLNTILQDVAKQSLIDMSKQNNAKLKTFSKIALSSFTAGTRAPTFKAARFFDVKDSIAFDYDVEWNSELEATMQVYATPLLGMAKLPIKIKNLQFDGTVRIIMTPVIDQAPGYGAMLLSFTKAPNISLDLEVLGTKITKLKFLKKEIMSQIKKSIEQDMLWPRRQVIPSQIEVNNIKRDALTPQVLSDLQTSDPLLKAEDRLLLSIFRFLDKDNDGGISREELEVGLSMMNKQMPEDYDLFDELDKDNNGVIDIDEFSEIFEKDLIVSSMEPVVQVKKESVAENQKTEVIPKPEQPERKESLLRKSFTFFRSRKEEQNAVKEGSEEEKPKMEAMPSS